MDYYCLAREQGFAVARGKNRFLGALRPYFNVNNRYVVNKLQLILCPFRHRYWVRESHNDETKCTPPRDDINAPDLYLPLMAFATHVLTAAVGSSILHQFTPDQLSTTASTNLAALALEVLILECGFHFLDGFTVPVLDLAAYCAYKFVGVTLACERSLDDQRPLRVISG